MIKATETKLRSGKWGALVRGFVRPGNDAQLTKDSGEVCVVAVVRVLWQADGVSLCQIRRSTN